MKSFTAIMLMTTMIATGTSLSSVAYAANDIIASETGTKNVAPGMKGERESAAQFVHLLSQARYSINIKDTESATRFVREALNIGESLAKATAPVRGVQTGRVDYDLNDDDDDHFYRIDAGAVTNKQVGLGPFWADKKGLAVKDAEVVYLTVDLREADFREDLNEALKDLANNDLEDADDEISDVIEEVASIDAQESAPEIKARDNLELANHYMEAQNYDGARYPLKHARDALETMKNDDRFKGQETQINNYLSEIDKTEEVIAKKDPTALEKMQQNVESWWNDMKEWASAEDNNRS